MGEPITLIDLPVELLERLAYHADEKSLRNSRLACEQVSFGMDDCFVERKAIIYLHPVRFPGSSRHDSSTTPSQEDQASDDRCETDSEPRRTGAKNHLAYAHSAKLDKFVRSRAGSLAVLEKVREQWQEEHTAFLSGQAS